MGKRAAKLDQCSKAQRDLLFRSRWQRVCRNYQKEKKTRKKLERRMAPAMPCKRNKQQSSIVKTNIMQKQMFMRTSAKQCKLYGGISRVKKHEDRIARIHLLWHKKILHKFYRIWRSPRAKRVLFWKHKETQRDKISPRCFIDGQKQT